MALNVELLVNGIKFRHEGIEDYLFEEPFVYIKHKDGSNWYAIELVQAIEMKRDSGDHA